MVRITTVCRFQTVVVEERIAEVITFQALAFDRIALRHIYRFDYSYTAIIPISTITFCGELYFFTDKIFNI